MCIRRMSKNWPPLMCSRKGVTPSPPFVPEQWIRLRIRLCFWFCVIEKLECLNFLFLAWIWNLVFFSIFTVWIWHFCMFQRFHCLNFWLCIWFCVLKKNVFDFGILYVSAYSVHLDPGQLSSQGKRLVEITFNLWEKDFIFEPGISLTPRFTL